jgi:hypothetical protein
VEVVERCPREAPRAGRSRCSGPARMSRPLRLPWDLRWLERAMRLRCRGPKFDSATARRRARSWRSPA